MVTFGKNLSNTPVDALSSSRIGVFGLVVLIWSAMAVIIIKGNFKSGDMVAGFRMGTPTISGALADMFGKRAPNEMNPKS